MDELVRDFLTEASESLDIIDVELVGLGREPGNARILDTVFRLLHTIKGTCGFLGLPRLEALIHAEESLLARFRDGAAATPEAVALLLESVSRIKAIIAGLAVAGQEPPGRDDDIVSRLEAMALGGPAPAGGIARAEPEPAAESSVEASAGPPARPGDQDDPGPAVPPDALEQLAAALADLVMTRDRLLDIARRLADPGLVVLAQRLSYIAADLQDGVGRARLQPVGTTWRRLPPLVRHLGRELGKQIELEMTGAETEIDCRVLDALGEALVHMVRNAADHGIERPAQRRAAGKPEAGSIRLAAFRVAGHAVIEVADDGRGLDCVRIGRTLVETGRVAEGELAEMTEAELHRCIFMPGFSTAGTVTHVSGRGVGMDVVRSNVEWIGGSVQVTSVAGAGSVFTIRIPLKGLDPLTRRPAPAASPDPSISIAKA